MYLGVAEARSVRRISLPRPKTLLHEHTKLEHVTETRRCVHTPYKSHLQRHVAIRVPR